MKPLDIEFMKKLHSKVNIVPVIAKADCLTKREIQRLKMRILQEIEDNGIKIYSLPECDSDEDEEYKEQVRQLKEAVPFAVCGATTLIEVKGRKVRGRLYPWGVVEVENPDHCDFIKLRTMLMWVCLNIIFYFIIIFFFFLLVLICKICKRSRRRYTTKIIVPNGWQRM